jgi:hypothetical protein
MITFAGNGTFGPHRRRGYATSATLNNSKRVAVDCPDNLHIADTGNSVESEGFSLAQAVATRLEQVNILIGW